MTAAPHLRLGVVLSVLVASGCTTTEVQAPGATDGLATATAEVAPSLAPASVLPRDSREVSGTSFTLAAPAAFRQYETEGPDGVPVLVLEKPAQFDGAVHQVLAFDAVEPTSGVEDGMFVLGQLKTDLEGVDDFVRGSVVWPGATVAVVGRWTELTTTSGGQFTEEYVQLAIEVDDELHSTVIAVAPAAEFEESGVLDVLRTFTPDSAA